MDEKVINQQLEWTAGRVHLFIASGRQLTCKESEYRSVVRDKLNEMVIDAEPNTSDFALIEMDRLDELFDYPGPRTGEQLSATKVPHGQG